MIIKNFNLSSKRIAFISLLCCTVIAASFFTLKSNSFRNMWSLADSNVEALSISESYSDFRYIGYINAEHAKNKGQNGSFVYLNMCNNGTGACHFDKWHNIEGKFTLEGAFYACIACRNDLLDAIRDIFSEIQDEGGLMMAIATLFK